MSTLDTWLNEIVDDPDAYRDNLAVFADWLSDRDDSREPLVRDWLALEARLAGLPPTPGDAVLEDPADGGRQFADWLCLQFGGAARLLLSSCLRHAPLRRHLTDDTSLSLVGVAGGLTSLLRTQLLHDLHVCGFRPDEPFRVVADAEFDIGQRYTLSVVALDARSSLSDLARVQLTRDMRLGMLRFLRSALLPGYADKEDVALWGLSAAFHLDAGDWSLQGRTWLRECLSWLHFAARSCADILNRLNGRLQWLDSTLDPGRASS